MSVANRFCPANDEKRGAKCVVWDLDDTLWHGTLLEGDKVCMAPGVPEVIRELDNRGILQSIASKNDFAAAWHKLTVFGLDEFFLHPQINWANKSDSIRAIAEKLQIGLDTVVFIDDQPFERDEVTFNVPEVTTIDAAEISRLLDMPMMQPRFVTDESRIRRKMYQADIQRNQSEERFAGTREEFLATLGMCMAIKTAGEEDLRRAEELTIRTNQLNTTGRIFSHAELEKLLHSGEHLLLVAELEDRYGTSGTIGLSLIEKGTEAWVIKLLIMSCRVLTRGVGTIMLSHILQCAKRNGVRLHAEFVASDRNRIMYITLRFNGFCEVAEVDGVILLEHDLRDIRPFPRYVSIRSSV